MPPDDGRHYFTLVCFGATGGNPRPGWAAAIRRRARRRSAVWFCADHLPLAREHEHFPVDEALAAIQARLHGTPLPGGLPPRAGPL